MQVFANQNQVQQLESAGFRMRPKGDSTAPWEYISFRAPEEWEFRGFDVQRVYVEVGKEPACLTEISDAALFRFGSDYGFPMTMQQSHPEVGPVYWSYRDLSPDEYPSAREAMVAEIQKRNSEGTAPAWLNLGPEAIEPIKGAEPSDAMPAWLGDLLKAAEQVLGNAEYRTETERRQFCSYLEDLNTKAEALRKATPLLIAGLVPFSYADPQAYLNFQHGVANREWMWSRPDSGLITLYALPGQLAKPEVLPRAQNEEHDLLMIARTSGLRGYLHGVNATSARELLADFIAALPMTRQLQLLDDFFLTTERALIQHQNEPTQVVAQLQALIKRTQALRGAEKSEPQESNHG